MFFNILNRTNNITEVSGSFAPNGSSAVASTSVKGAGFSVARTGTGVFVVTLNPAVQYAEMVAKTVQLHMGTPDGSYASVTTFTLGSTGTVTITTYIPTSPAGVYQVDPADIAAAATNRIDFNFKLRRSARPS